MAGTKEGAAKAAATNRKKYGEDFYSRIGTKGGAKPHRETRPFFMNREAARKAGAKGGRISRRGRGKGKGRETAEDIKEIEKNILEILEKEGEEWPTRKKSRP